MNELHLNNLELSFLASLIIKELAESNEVAILEKVLTDERLVALINRVDETNYTEISIESQGEVVADALEKLLKQLGV